jgi:hypothetical protein
VPVVLLIAAAAILCGVIVVAMGRGGEMAPSEADSRPLDAEILTAADVALLRPPMALWGYDTRATDDALNLVARTVTERDIEIASLRRQIADLRSAAGNPRSRPAADGPPSHPAAGSPPSPPPAADGPGSAPPHRPRPPDGWLPPADSLAPPFRHGIGGPRPPADERPWSAWERSSTAPVQDLHEPGEGG